MLATTLQIKRISTMLTLLKLNEQKTALVSSFSNGRTETRKELTMKEANDFIAYLQKEVSKTQDAANQMRRKLIAKCHNMGWETSPGKVDMNRLNEWCKANGYLHKDLMQYTAEELPNLVSQFDMMYKKHIQKVR